MPMPMPMRPAGCCGAARRPRPRGRSTARGQRGESIRTDVAHTCASQQRAGGWMAEGGADWTRRPPPLECAGRRSGAEGDSLPLSASARNLRGPPGVSPADGDGPHCLDRARRSASRQMDGCHGRGDNHSSATSADHCSHRRLRVLSSPPLLPCGRPTLRRDVTSLPAALLQNRIAWVAKAALQQRQLWSASQPPPRSLVRHPFRLLSRRSMDETLAHSPPPSLSMCPLRSHDPRSHATDGGPAAAPTIRSGTRCAPLRHDSLDDEWLQPSRQTGARCLRPVAVCAP